MSGRVFDPSLKLDLDRVDLLLGAFASAAWPELRRAMQHAQWQAAADKLSAALSQWETLSIEAQAETLEANSPDPEADERLAQLAEAERLYKTITRLSGELLRELFE